MPILDARTLKRVFERNLPTILSGIAVVGVIGTVILAVKATPKAEEEISSAQGEEVDDLCASDERSPDAVAREVSDNWTYLKSAKACWRCYIPAGLTGVATIACIIGANAIGLRRNAALLAAYTLVDTSFREYKDKVVEHITAQKAQKIDDEIMAEKIKKNPPKTETIVLAGGDSLCYDSLTGRYFKSTAEKILRAAQDLDARILQGDMYASQNEFYNLLGLDGCTFGNELGWTIHDRIKIVFSSHITESNEACLAVGYEKLPVYNYDKL
jgi:hypothetical protein